LLRALESSFRVSQAPEYTLEAGRPDTLTAEKLSLMRRHAVTRVSVNPQTGNDGILARIGRRHTAADIERAMELVRDAGFPFVNCDLIAGLPGDSPEGFANSLRWLLGMRPENITVHALTLKRASFFREGQAEFSKGADGMVRGAYDALRERGYFPYYLYRQKGTVGGLENTGYALPGAVCRYNIYMMHEIHTVLACGAGAVTKLVDRNSGSIRRIRNLKYPADYLKDPLRIGRNLGEIESFYRKARENKLQRTVRTRGSGGD